MNGGRIPLVLVVTAIALVSVAPAGELEHTVRSGEYASLIAETYYGRVEAAELLLSYNGKSGTVIHAGETMRVPYCDVHRVEPGETWSGLAQRYLGRASAYPTIATLNGLEPGRPLNVGQRIAMPVVVAHELARGETLAKLADRFYGDARMGRLLEGFNGIDDPRRLSVGTKVDIPLVSLRLVAELESPAPAGDPPPDPEPPAREEAKEFEAPILEARRVYEMAEFDGASAALERIRGDVESRGSDAERAELWRLVAFVNVALDRRDDACAAYESLALLGPAETEFDPDLVSPKIRRTLGECDRGRPVMTHSATKERHVRTLPFGAPHLFVLAVVEGDDPAAVYRIQRTESVLGRAETADLHIDDPEVSQRHCVLFVDGPLCGLRDLGSRNGTFVNGRRLRPEVLQRLRHLDEIEVGSIRLVFLAGRFRPRPEA